MVYSGEHLNSLRTTYAVVLNTELQAYSEVVCYSASFLVSVRLFRSVCGVGVACGLPRVLFSTERRLLIVPRH